MNFIVLMAAIFILGLICVYAYFVIKKEFGLNSYEDYAKKKIDKHLDDIIKKSEHLLDESSEKMRVVLLQTHHFSRDLESQAKSTFSEFRERYVKSMNAELAEVEKQYEEQFYRNMRELRTLLDAKLKDQMQKSDKLVEVFTKNEYERVKKELDEFQKNQEDTMAQKVQVLVAKVLEEAVQKSLSREDQKKLIQDAIDSVKKDSFGVL